MNGIIRKRALITGGGSGIGLGIALKLVEMGAEVFIIERNKENLKNALKISGNKGFALEVDVANWSLTREAIKPILSIELLVNNAGVTKLKSVLEDSEDDFDTLMNVNVKGAINLTQAVAQDLILRNLGGKVVSISSQTSARPHLGYLMYCSSKVALDMATKCFALELGPKNIRVNTVNPTLVRTELARIVWSDPVKSASMLSRNPLGRFAEVEEIVNAVIFLLSDNSNMINGHCLFVDGGYTVS